MEEKKESLIKALTDYVGYPVKIDESPPATNSISGIIRYAPTEEEAKRLNKVKRENAIRGETTKKAASKGGKEKAKEIKRRNRVFQTEAEKIWNKNPALSKNSVARTIIKQQNLSLSPQTMRRIIKKNPH